MTKNLEISLIDDVGETTLYIKFKHLNLFKEPCMKTLEMLFAKTVGTSGFALFCS